MDGSNYIKVWFGCVHQRANCLCSICTKTCWGEDSRVLGAADSHARLPRVTNMNQLFWPQHCSITALKVCKLLCYYYLCFFSLKACMPLLSARKFFSHSDTQPWPFHPPPVFSPLFLLQAGNEHRRFCASLWRGSGPPTLPNDSTWCWEMRRETGVTHDLHCSNTTGPTVRCSLWGVVTGRGVAAFLAFHFTPPPLLLLIIFLLPTKCEVTHTLQCLSAKIVLIRTNEGCV